jgi:DNA polymerase III delta prime subunit
LDLLRQTVQTEIPHRIFASLAQGRFLQARQLALQHLRSGYGERDLIDIMHTYLMGSTGDAFTAKQGEVLMALMHADYQLTQGVSKGLQVNALLWKISEILRTLENQNL